MGDRCTRKLQVTFKLWREITHAKELQYRREDVERFLQLIAAAGSKKGCILIQFPASIKLPFFPMVRSLLEDMVSSDHITGWRLALEFRDMSWYTDPVYEMLETYQAIVVMHDIPKAHTPLIDMQRKFIYLRFHGEKGDYRGSYSDEFLQEWAVNIQEWMEEGLDVFAYFNNTMGSAFQNARDLRGYVGVL